MPFISLASLNFAGTLTAGISSTDVALPIESALAEVLCEALGNSCPSCLPDSGTGDDSTANHSYLQIEDPSGAFEIVRVTGCVSGIPVMERGQDGTTASSFPAGACVRFIWGSMALEDYIQEVLKTDAAKTIIAAP